MHTADSDDDPDVETCINIAFNGESISLVDPSRRGRLYKKALQKVKEISWEIQVFAGKNVKALQIPQLSQLSNDAIDTKEEAIKNINELAEQADQALCEEAYFYFKDNIKKRLDKVLEQFKVRIVDRAFRAGFSYQKPDVVRLVPTAPPLSEEREHRRSKPSKPKASETAKDNEKFWVCLS